MQNAALGLKSVFRSITNRTLLRALFDTYAPSVRVNWKADKDELPEELFRACDELRRKAKPEHANIICMLQEVCDVCADGHSPERLVGGVNDAGLMKRFKAEVKMGHRELQNAAVWLLLNAPEAWSHLVVSAKALHIQAKTWDEFRVQACERPRAKDLPALRAAIADYLVKETLHGEHVHIEMDEDGLTFRFLVSVNNFPVNVQQFDVKGDYAIARDANALNFMFEYAHDMRTLRMKCPFEIKKRRDLAAIFADAVLHAELVGTENAVFNLSAHLESRILPLATCSSIVSARQTGLTVSFRNARGKKESCALTTQGATNLQERMKRCLDLFGVAQGSVSVVEVLYEVSLGESNGRTRKVNARIAPDGIHVICRDRDERRIVTDYLKKAVA